MSNCLLGDPQVVRFECFFFGGPVEFSLNFYIGTNKIADKIGCVRFILI